MGEWGGGGGGLAAGVLSSVRELPRLGDWGGGDGSESCCEEKPVITV